MIRYLLDENVPHAIARGLRLRGVDVLTATGAGLLSTNDETIVEYAYHNKLVIFTQDDDFLKLAASGVTHAGIVYSKTGSPHAGRLGPPSSLDCRVPGTVGYGGPY